MNSAKRRIAIASKTVTGQCGSSTVLQQMNVQSDHQWADSSGCGSKTGSVKGGVKYHWDGHTHNDASRAGAALCAVSKLCCWLNDEIAYFTVR